MNNSHPSQKVRLGLVGFGRLGSIHARNIANSRYAQLYAVCDTNPDALQQVTSLYEDVHTVDDIQSLLLLPIDGVVIASNTHLHLEHIQLAARAGKHIFTEKPIGLTMEEADETLQVVVESGVKFQIGFQRRWDPRFLKAKSMIDSGKIGTPILYKAYGRDPNASNPLNWGLDKNGGLFLNASIHDYDTARFMLGSEAIGVTASGAALAYPDLEQHNDIDTSNTSLFFSNKSMAITEWSRYARHGYGIEAEVIGTEGAIRIGREYADSVTLLQRNDDAPGVIDEFDAAYASEIDAFAQAIINDTPASPGIEDSRIALHIALQARASFEQESKHTAIRKLTPLVKE